MLTGEFSSDLLPKMGDYRLGAIDDGLGRPAGSTPDVDAKDDPFAFDLANDDTASVPASPMADNTPPAPPVPAPPTAVSQPPAPAPPTALSRDVAGGPGEVTGPVAPFNSADFPPPALQGEAGGARRGAHDIDPDQLGFNVVPEDDGSFGSFVPDLDDGPFAVPTNDGPEPKLFDRPANEVPTVSTSSARLFDELGGLPAVAEEDGGRLFPPKSDVFGDAGPAAPTVAAGSPPAPAFGAPLIDLTSDLKYSTPSTTATPVALERSTIVDPSQGPPAGSSFLEQAAGQYGNAGGVVSDAGATVSLQEVATARPPGSMRAPDKATVQRREMLLDVVDRQWFTSALVATVAITVGVLGWLVFLRSGDGNEEIVAASTTTVDVASSLAQGAGAGAAARSEQTEPSLTTTTTEPSTTRSTVATQPATNRPVTTAPTTSTSETTVTTEPSTTTTESTVASTTTTEESTTTTEESTTTTEESTTTTEESTTTTEESTTTTEESTTTTEDTTTTTEDPDPGPDPDPDPDPDPNPSPDPDPGPPVAEPAAGPLP